MSIELDFLTYIAELKRSGAIDDYADETQSTNKPDFIINCGARKIAIELKEKKKPYNLRNWPAFSSLGVTDERHAFIEDELSVRRLIYFAPYSHLIVKDIARNALYSMSLLDLFCMPHVRVNRPVYESGNFKGKWLLDLRNARRIDDPRLMLASIIEEVEQLDAYYGVGPDEQANIMECHGKYCGEVLREGGIPRTAEHRNEDLRGK